MINFFPDGIDKCPIGEATCVGKIGEIVLEKYAEGLNDINFPNINPLEIDNIHISQDPSSPVNIDLKIEKQKSLA